MPNDAIIQSTHTGELPIPHLPPEARKTHLFPSLGDTSLISIGQLCDAGCRAVFTATEALVLHKEDIVLRGKRDATTNGLWTLTVLEKPQ